VKDEKETNRSEQANDNDETKKEEDESPKDVPEKDSKSSKKVKEIEPEEQTEASDTEKTEEDKEEVEELEPLKEVDQVEEEKEEPSAEQTEPPELQESEPVIPESELPEPSPEPAPESISTPEDDEDKQEIPKEESKVDVPTQDVSPEETTEQDKEGTKLDLDSEAELEPETKLKPDQEPDQRSEPKDIEPIDESETKAETADETEKEQSDSQLLDIELESLDSKLIAYNDFLPTKDTHTVISHLDVDGVLCVAALIKMLNSTQKDEKIDEEENKLRIFFTSPTKVFSTLAKSVPELSKISDDEFQIGKLYICDLSVNRDTVLGATIYNDLKWFDHHEVDSSEQPESEIENSELIIDPLANSTTSIICNYFKIDDELGKIADEVDTNQIESEEAKRINEIIGALKLKYTGTKLKRLLFDFAYKMAEDISVINDEKYDTIIQEYKKWLDDCNKYASERIQITSINDHKVGIIETENVAPVFSIYNELKNHPEAPLDILIIMIHKYFKIGKDRNNKLKNKRFTKLEFRTYTDKDILELAKLFGGGGHKYASGATVMDGLDKEELLKNIESYYFAPTESMNNE
jgi:oligoribonuclease NrnB/cAMP/cGMP phosphodiesterase (DHH superfamily)